MDSMEASSFFLVSSSLLTASILEDADLASWDTPNPELRGLPEGPASQGWELWLYSQPSLVQLK